MSGLLADVGMVPLSLITPRSASGPGDSLSGSEKHSESSWSHHLKLIENEPSQARGQELPCA